MIKFRAMLIFMCVLMLTISCLIVSCKKKVRIDIDSFILKINQYYNDSFSYEASGEQPWYAEYAEIILRSEKLNGTEVVFRVSNEDSFSDNYIPVKYRTMVEQKIKGIAETVFGSDVLIINSVGKVIPNQFASDTTFEDYCKATGNGIMCALIASADCASVDLEKVAQALRDGLENNEIKAELRIYLYDMIDVSSVEIIDSRMFDFEPNATITGTLRIDDDYSLKLIDWR
ncbi:MAG: hypothetical protein IKZ82_11660 [Clostridia bacterium]|nr:hypothetical protein [Clostridia bacterium]